MSEEREKLYVGKAPAEAVLASARRQRERIARQRARLKSETNRTQFAYYCSLCLIIRDENEYLEEWLRWHLGQGAEHFYVYDHGSKRPVREFIAALGADLAEKVTVIDWSGKHKDAQPEAYRDCLNRFRGESRWIGFIDTDEHIRVLTGQTLSEFLRDYEDCAGLFAIWVTYGANGRIEKSAEPLRKRFTTVSHGDGWAEKVGKLIAQPMYMTDMMIHNGCAAEGFDIVGEHKQKFHNYYLTLDPPTRDLIVVDHFYTKSYEEWMNKLRRGSSHANFARRYNEFFGINPDLETCREKSDVRQEYERYSAP